MLKKFQRLRDWSRRFEARRTKRGVISFHFSFFRSNPDWKGVESFRQQFGVDKIFLVHGLAFQRNGVTTIVSGPRGIGKSTTLRQIAKVGEVLPIDDGILVLGREKQSGKFFLFETGRYNTDKAKSIVSKVLRDVTGYKSVHLREPVSKTRLKLATKFGDTIGSLAIFFGRFIARDESHKTYSPKKFPVGKLVLASHPQMGPQLTVLEENTVSRTGFDPLEKEFAGKIEIVKMESAQKGFQKRLSEAMQS